jgi:hypothetical protein
MPSTGHSRKTDRSIAVVAVIGLACSAGHPHIGWIR